MARHLLSLLDLTPEQTIQILELADQVKAHPREYRRHLDGKSIAVIFAKPSTRTRVSFEVGIQQLGAQPVILDTGRMQMGRGESIHDTAKTLSRYVDGIVIRTFEQAHIEGLAQHGSVPVVNALTDLYHPCQALADAQALRERFGDLQGRKLVYAGAGNNVAHSLMLLGPRVGMDVVVACPEIVPPEEAVLALAQKEAEAAGTQVSVSHNLREAVQNADAIYTDTWVSMGQDEEADKLREALKDFAINSEIMTLAKKDAVFMHCLPAHRGEEVTNEVIDSQQSIVFEEAENRLHAQKALLLYLLEAA